MPLVTHALNVSAFGDGWNSTTISDFTRQLLGVQPTAGGDATVTISFLGDFEFPAGGTGDEFALGIEGNFFGWFSGGEYQATNAGFTIAQAAWQAIIADGIIDVTFDMGAGVQDFTFIHGQEEFINITFTWDAPKTIQGTQDADFLSGTEQSDIITGFAGNDTIHGLGGNDTVDAGLGDDYVIGGEGADSASLGGGNDTFFAGEGDAGADSVLGGAGNDVIGGGAGADRLEGGLGSDTLYGGADGDTLVLGVWVNLTASDDDLGAVNVAWAGAGNDTVSGSASGDLIGLGADGDAAFAHAGNDTIYAGAGIDGIYGGDGNDEAYGGTGDDDLVGDAGNDTLYGGAGDDSIVGGTGDDVLWGGAGEDTLIGDSGTDTFGFAVATTALDADTGNNDLIADFVEGEDGDVLDLSDFGLSGDLADLIADGYIVAGGLDLNSDGTIDIDIAGLVTTDLTANNVII